jgi:hypothetical protein
MALAGEQAPELNRRADARQRAPQANSPRSGPQTRPVTGSAHVDETRSNPRDTQAAKRGTTTQIFTEAEPSRRKARPSRPSRPTPPSAAKRPDNPRNRAM